MHTERTRFSWLQSVCYIFCLLSLSFQSVEAEPCRLNPFLIKGKPIALVIANSQYKNQQISQAIHDAKAMENILRRLGFDVFFQKELGNSEMDRATVDFSNCLKQTKGVGLFYFTGYGMQLEGENYLLPIDVIIRDRFNIIHDTFAIKKLLDRLGDAKNKLNIVILDAGRRSSYHHLIERGGLASISPPSGFFIAYPSEINKFVDDQNSRNSLYITELTKVLEKTRRQHKRIEDVFMDITNIVEANSNNKQIPWYNGSLKEKFCFGVGGCDGNQEQLPCDQSLGGNSTLIIRSNQSDATVLIKGKKGECGKLNNNRWKMTLPEGSYTIQLQKGNKYSQEKPINIISGKTHRIPINF